MAERLSTLDYVIVAAFVFVPFFWRLGIYTIPEYMEYRYNAGVRVALALCWLAFMACNLGIMLLASAKMMAVLFGSMPLGGLVDVAGGLLALPETPWICVTAILVGVYTCAGGLAAVVYTDAIQCAVMIAGCLLLVVLGLWEIGGVGQLRSEIAAIEREQRAAAEVSAEVVERTALILPVDTRSPMLFALSQPAVATRLGLAPLFQISEPFLYFSVWAFLVTLGLVIVISWMTRTEPEQKIASLLYRRPGGNAP